MAKWTNIANQKSAHVTNGGKTLSCFYDETPFACELCENSDVCKAHADIIKAIMEHKRNQLYASIKV